MPSSKQQPQQHRQIRALLDAETITVYQAYNSDIAAAAVRAQRLNASPLFRPSRMTWIKPSWKWMMYRCGYSYKDANQSNVLALKLTHAFFLKLLRASVESGSADVSRDGKQVRVQWDPERSVRLLPLPNDEEGRSVRSIQIGIPSGLVDEWVSDGIAEIEDVTERARLLKDVLENDAGVENEVLLQKGLVPLERVYELPEDICTLLGITKKSIV